MKKQKWIKIELFFLRKSNPNDWFIYIQIPVKRSRVTKPKHERHLDYGSPEMSPSESAKRSARLASVESPRMKEKKPRKPRLL
jgi:hypothetical protein